MKKEISFLATLLLTGVLFFTSCGSGGTMKDKNGKKYKTVKIGNQEWMAENLNYATPRGSWCYGDDPANCEKYGRLYDWETACNVCPDGWHLPSDAEWARLFEFLIANGYNYDGTIKGNKIAKSMAASTDWNTSSITGAIGNDLSANNKSGFAALPGGYRYYDGRFHNLGDAGIWWSTTKSPYTDVWYRYIYYLSNNAAGRDFVSMWFGASVRCIKDSVRQEVK